jgi:hypothetical protein
VGPSDDLPKLYVSRNTYKTCHETVQSPHAQHGLSKESHARDESNANVSNPNAGLLTSYLNRTVGPRADPTL